MAKTRFPSVLAAVAALVIGASAVVLWSGQQTKEKPKSTAPSAQTPKPPAKPAESPSKGDPYQGEYPPQPSPGAPKMSVTANLAQDGIGLVGRPVLFEARIASGRLEGEIKAVTLSKPGAFWGELVFLEIYNEGGDLMATLKPKLISKGDPAATFDGTKAGWLVWVLESNAALIPGEYSIRAKIENEKSEGDGWKGKAWSPPTWLTIKPANAELDDDEKRMVALVEIRVAGAQNQLAEALQACDRFLAANPSDVSVLEEKGDVLHRMGKPAEAIQVYEAALKVPRVREENSIEEPPSGLLRKRQMAAEAVKKGG